MPPPTPPRVAVGTAICEAIGLDPSLVLGLTLTVNPVDGVTVVAELVPTTGACIDQAVETAHLTFRAIGDDPAASGCQRCGRGPLLEAVVS